MATNPKASAKCPINKARRRICTKQQPRCATSANQDELEDSTQRLWHKKENRLYRLQGINMSTYVPVQGNPSRLCKTSDFIKQIQATHNPNKIRLARTLTRNRYTRIHQARDSQSHCMKLWEAHDECAPTIPHTSTIISTKQSAKVDEPCRKLPWHASSKHQALAQHREVSGVAKPCDVTDN